jgi:hypothetical protein
MTLSRSDAKFLLGITIAGLGPAAAETLRELSKREQSSGGWEPKVYAAIANILDTAAKDPEKVADAIETAYDTINRRTRRWR